MSIAALSRFFSSETKSKDVAVTSFDSAPTKNVGRCVQDDSCGLSEQMMIPDVVKMKASQSQFLKVCRVSE